MTTESNGAPPARYFHLDQLPSLPDDPYREFLRVPSLNCGVYRLAAGQPDLQSPHEEDEVYYVVAGQGRFKAGDEDQAVSPGSVLFVRAGIEHRFHSITKDLEILVFFSSAPSR